VFFVKTKESINDDFYINGIGCFQAEGFGQVLINPEFLMSESSELHLKLEKSDLTYIRQYAVKTSSEDKNIFSALIGIKESQSEEMEIDQLVNKFITDNKSKFKGLSNSQWGQLRSIARSGDNAKFKISVLDQDKGFIYKGVKEIEWRRQGRREILVKELQTIEREHPKHYLDFIIKLCSQMTKKTN
jgi:hypothetical protein